MDQKGHSLDLQKLIITQLTKLTKNSASVLDTTAKALSLTLYLFSDYVSKSVFLLAAQPVKPNKTVNAPQSLTPPAQPLLGVQHQVLPLLAGNAS